MDNCETGTIYIRVRACYNAIENEHVLIFKNRTFIEDTSPDKPVKMIH